MAQETNHSQAPMLCSTGCGFYGNPRTNGMCSVCYKEHLQRQNSSSGRISPPVHRRQCPRRSVSTRVYVFISATRDPEQRALFLLNVILHVVSDTTQQPSEEQSKSLEKPKQKKNRCFMCRKKVGLTGFECRCGNVYCGVHRYSDVHNCSYNYKADAAEKIRKENPVVVGEKIQKI
ncbi:hypothetical protein U0070_021189 [Myodes glareolus]|uniref:AN1-type zinc finger protein 6 n=1 Tax=Myodes glareolus TaxID=447135 RepID=A0AAW0IM20_MYOGA